MADNFTYKNAAGETRTGRSDQVGDVDYPGVKVYDGTPEGTTPLAISAEGALVRLGAPMRYATETGAFLSPDGTWDDAIAANASRRSLSLYNAGSSLVEVAFGANTGAFTTVPKFALAPGQYYEMPSLSIYTGIIALRCPAGSGQVNAYEG